MSMQELRRMARAYYRVSNKDIKDRFKAFTKAMDPGKKGYVRFKEFFNYMVLIGYDPASRMCTKQFFKELNEDGSGELLELDKKTLFYIVYGGIPFCDGNCKQLIKANSYFTCVNCFESGRDVSCNVCSNCFLDGKYEHHHKEFLDPTVLLNFVRSEKAFKNKLAADRTSANTNYKQGAPKADASSSHVPVKQRAPKTGASSSHVSQLQSSSSTSTALIKFEDSPREKLTKGDWLSMGYLGVQLLSALVAAQMCTVM